MTLPLDRIIADVGPQQVLQWRHAGERIYHNSRVKNVKPERDFVHAYICNQYSAYKTRQKMIEDARLRQEGIGE